MPRSEVVSVSTLSKSLDRAIALAGKRYGVSFGGDNLIHKWEILGRILREKADLSQASVIDVATAVAKGAGLKGTPVATKIGKDILVGVIARDLNVRF